jgi:hypothetical protein
MPDVITAGLASNPLNQSSRVRSPSTTSHGSSTDSPAHHRVGVSNPEDAARPLYKKDALYTGSTQKIHHTSHTSLEKGNPYMSSITDLPAATKGEKKKDSAPKAFADILAAMTDFSILKNKQMLLICIGNIFSMLGYYLPIMCLISFAVDDMKVDQSRASFLLTIFGILKKNMKIDFNN